MSFFFLLFRHLYMLVCSTHLFPPLHGKHHEFFQKIVLVFFPSEISDSPQSWGFGQGHQRRRFSSWGRALVLRIHPSVGLCSTDTLYSLGAHQKPISVNSNNSISDGLLALTRLADSMGSQRE